jgi:hypothetical protein
MIVTGALGDAETDGDLVQKRRIGQLGADGEMIIADMKHQFEHANGQAAAAEQRPVGFAVQVGRGLDYLAPTTVFDGEEFNADASGGFSPSGVEDVCCESGFGHSVLTSSGST